MNDFLRLEIASEVARTPAVNAVRRGSLFLRSLGVAMVLLVGAAKNSYAYAEIPGSIVRFSLATRGQGRYVYTRDVSFTRDGQYHVLQDRGYPTVDGYPDQSSPPVDGRYSITPDPVNAAAFSLVLFPDNGSAAVYTSLEFHSPFRGNYGGFTGGQFQVCPPAPVSGAANVSNRTWLAEGRPSITGFILAGTEWRWVVVRVVGPGLSKFGVAPVVSRPSFQLFSGPTAMDQEVGAWTGDLNLVPGLKRAFEMAGAFPLEETSADAAALYLLPAGAYTVIARTSGAEGEALTEMYVLPYGS